MPILTYWHWIVSDDTLCGFDYAIIFINGLEIDSYDLCQATNTNDWEQYNVDLSAYAGQTVTFQILVETDDIENSTLYIDDAAFP